MRQGQKEDRCKLSVYSVSAEPEPPCLWALAMRALYSVALLLYIPLRKADLRATCIMLALLLQFTKVLLRVCAHLRGIGARPRSGVRIAHPVILRLMQPVDAGSGAYLRGRSGSDERRDRLERLRSIPIQPLWSASAQDF